MSEPLIDATNPTIERLQEDGFKITMHVYLRDSGTYVAFSAHNKRRKRTFNGRSRSGDREEALLDLAKDAGILVPGMDFGDLDPFEEDEILF